MIVSQNDLVKTRRRRFQSKSHHSSTRRNKRLAFENLERRTLLAAFIWNSDADGNWNDAANWSSDIGGVPGTSDTVTIDRGDANPVITIDSSVRVSALTSSESIVMQADLRVDNEMLLTDGEFDWQAGWLRTGSLMTDRHATLRVTSEAAKRFSGNWTNAGVVGQEQPFESPSRGTTFRNAASGIWNLHRDFDVDSGFSTVFTNEGTLRKLSPSEAVFHGFDRLDHREGSLIEVLKGKLSLPESGTQSNPSSGATFNVAADASLDLLRGTSHFIGTYTGRGDGRVELSQGTIEARDFAGGTGAVFDFEEGLLHWTGGTIRTDSVNGDSFINAGHMTWSGSGERSLQGQEFRNRGTILQTDDGNSLFNSIGQGTFFHNETAAVYESRGTGGIVGGSVFNAGTFRNEAGDSEYNSVFYAAAESLIDVKADRVRFVDGGDFDTSQILVAEDAILEIDSASSRNYKLLDGATLTGTGGGRVQFSNGTIESVDSNATLNFSEGMFHWIGGVFLRDITNAGHMTIAGPTAKRINNAFENTGTVIQESGTFVNSSSAGFTNAEGAVWELQGDASFGGTYLSQPSSLTPAHFARRARKLRDR